jgi:hypothetical protein
MDQFGIQSGDPRESKGLESFIFGIAEKSKFSLTFSSKCGILVVTESREVDDISKEDPSKEAFSREPTERKEPKDSDP